MCEIQQQPGVEKEKWRTWWDGLISKAALRGDEAHCCRRLANRQLGGTRPLWDSLSRPKGSGPCLLLCYHIDYTKWPISSSFLISMILPWDFKQLPSSSNLWYLESEFGHVTCFDQWGASSCDASRCIKCDCVILILLLLFCGCEENMHWLGC